MPADTTPRWRARAHQTAANFNWDYGCEKLRELIGQQCDLATALMIYWKGAPNFYRQYSSRAEIDLSKDPFDLLVEIEERVLHGFYMHRQLNFDPFDHDDMDWTRQHSGLKGEFRCELPQAMYVPVGKHDPSIRRMPLLSGKKGLPVGLSVIANVGWTEPTSERDLAIAALNKLDRDVDVVDLKDGRVVRVGLGFVERGGDDDLKHLQWFPELKHLELNRRFTDQGLAYLRFVPGLEILELSSPKFTDAGLVRLQQLPALEKLSLSCCAKITDAGLAHLTQLQKLEYLDLSSTRIGNDGLVHVAAIPQLKALELCWCTKITDRGLQHLALAKKMAELNLSSTKLTKGAVERLRKALPKCKVQFSVVEE